VTRPVAGLDGCPGGWLYVRKVENGQLEAGIAGDLSAVLEAIPDDTIVATDIPSGLTETGGRACDAAARDLLGWPRRARVFSAPVRGVLGIGTYREACDAHRAIDGRGMSRQSFAIMAKIAEVDAVLRTGTAALRERVAEIHPEVSFSLWNGGTAMVHAKKTAAGRAERRPSSTPSGRVPSRGWKSSWARPAVATASTTSTTRWPRCGPPGASGQEPPARFRTRCRWTSGACGWRSSVRRRSPTRPPSTQAGGPTR